MNGMELIRVVAFALCLTGGMSNLLNGNKYIAAACFFAIGLNFGRFL